MLVRVGVSPRCVLCFFLTPDVFEYIHITYSKRYLFSVHNDILIMYMHELSIQLLICIDL